MEYKEKLDRIKELAFQIDKPVEILRKKDKSLWSFEEKQISKDFDNLTNKSLTLDQSNMMIIDSGLLSNQAVLYFLPKLIEAVIFNNGDETVLLMRLKEVVENCYEPKIKKTLNSSIELLAYIEKMEDDEIDLEIDKARETWRMKRV